MGVEGRSERRDWKCNNRSTRSGISNQISFDKNITNRNRQQMQNINNLMRQWNASYRHVQYWQKNNTYRDMIVCAEQHCNMCKEIEEKLYNKELYGNVQKLV